MEYNGMPVFPVIFNDGENEFKLGDLVIIPQMDYNSFLTLICETIGISPNQVLVFLVKQNNNPNSMTLSEDSLVIPIAGNIGFQVLRSLKDRCYLVVLKRYLEWGTHREQTTSGAEFGGLSAENMHRRPPLPDNRNLRRMQRWEIDALNELLQIDDLEGAMIQNRLDNYNMATANGYVSDPNLYLDSFPPIVNSRLLAMEKNLPQKKKKAFCEECRKAKKTGVTTPFHPCVNDPVIAPFRTRFGPISRPTKHSSLSSS